MLLRRFISLRFKGSFPPLGAILRPGDGYQLCENVGDLGQFFAPAKPMGLEGLARDFGSHAVAGRAILGQDVPKGLLLLGWWMPAAGTRAQRHLGLGA